MKVSPSSKSWGAHNGQPRPAREGHVDPVPFVGVEVAHLAEGIVLNQEPLVVAVDHAQVFQGPGVTVELMGCGEGVKVEVRPMFELGLQRGPLPLEQALRLHVLLADLGLALMMTVIFTSGSTTSSSDSRPRACSSAISRVSMSSYSMTLRSTSRMPV